MNWPNVAVTCLLIGILALMALFFKKHIQGFLNIRLTFCLNVSQLCVRTVGITLKSLPLPEIRA